MLDFTIKDVSKYPNLIDLQIYINNGTQLFADVEFKKFSSINDVIKKYDLDHNKTIEYAISLKKDIILLDEDDVFFERDELEASGRKYEHLPHCSDEDYKRLLKDCFMYIIEHYSPSMLGCLVRLISHNSQHYKLIEQFLISEGFLTPKDLGQRVHSKGRIYADPNKGRNYFKKQLFILKS